MLSNLAKYSKILQHRKAPMKEAEEYMSQFKAYALATGRRMSLTHM